MRRSVRGGLNVWADFGGSNSVQADTVKCLSRVYGILAGYDDQNDRDTIRADPVFKLVARCFPDDADLARQHTLGRL